MIAGQCYHVFFIIVACLLNHPNTIMSPTLGMDKSNADVGATKISSESKSVSRIATDTTKTANTAINISCSIVNNETKLANDVTEISNTTKTSITANNNGMSRTKTSTSTGFSMEKKAGNKRKKTSTHPKRNNVSTDKETQDRA